MEIRQFQLNYPELLKLIKNAWPLEHKGYIDFTEGYLKYLIEAPDTDMNLTLGA